MKCPICKRELDSKTGICNYCGMHPNSHKSKKNNVPAKRQATSTTKKGSVGSTRGHSKTTTGSRQITRTPQLQSAIESLPKPLHQKLNKEIEKIPEIKLTERFEIIEKLGRGGMGEVFKAREKGLDRIVAIKRLIIKEEMAHIRLLSNRLARQKK